MDYGNRLCGIIIFTAPASVGQIYIEMTCMLEVDVDHLPRCVQASYTNPQIE